MHSPIDLLSSCPTALQHWKLTTLKPALTAQTFLNIILVSPVPSCHLAFFILSLSESKLLLSFIQVCDSCPPAPSKILFSRLEICAFQSVIYFLSWFFLYRSSHLYLCPEGKQSKVQPTSCIWKTIHSPSYCPKKIPNWELQMEMGRVSTEWLNLPASVNSHPQQFLQVSHFSCMNTLLLALCCQCWDRAAEGTSCILNVARSLPKQRATFWPQERSPQLSKCPFFSIQPHGAQKFSSEEQISF